MESDRRTADRAWLAVACSSEGEITQILRDDLGCAGEPGTHLSAIVDSGSSRKAENLITTLQKRGCVVGWQLNVPDRDGARTLYFAGSVSDDSLLILAASGRSSITELFDDLGASGVATPDALRRVLTEGNTDITAAMAGDIRLYEELSRLNNDLINRERELARKTAALERLSAEKSRLTAIAAHDLRNPLTVISSYADLLRIERAVEGEHLLYVEEISRSARFMMELVEEMLDSSRFESGHIDLHLQPIDLVNAANHAAAINRMRADRKHMTVIFEAATDRAFISADPVKLRQIINNLVVNAIKFSPGGSSVTIRVHSDTQHAFLEVKDEGIGIPADKRVMIFEAFETLGVSGTGGEKSTGLGLSIVKQLVDLHRATVSVESELGKGSIFRVSFPLAG